MLVTFISFTKNITFTHLLRVIPSLDPLTGLNGTKLSHKLKPPKERIQHPEPIQQSICSKSISNCLERSNFSELRNVISKFKSRKGQIETEATVSS